MIQVHPRRYKTITSSREIQQHQQGPLFSSLNSKQTKTQGHTLKVMHTTRGDAYVYIYDYSGMPGET